MAVTVMAATAIVVVFGAVVIGPGLVVPPGRCVVRARRVRAVRIVVIVVRRARLGATQQRSAGAQRTYHRDLPVRALHGAPDLREREEGLQLLQCPSPRRLLDALHSRWFPGAVKDRGIVLL